MPRRKQSKGGSLSSDAVTSLMPKTAWAEITTTNEVAPLTKLSGGAQSFLDLLTWKKENAGKYTIHHQSLAGGNGIPPLTIPSGVIPTRTGEIQQATLLNTNTDAVGLDYASSSPLLLGGASHKKKKSSKTSGTKATKSKSGSKPKPKPKTTSAKPVKKEVNKEKKKEKATKKATKSRGTVSEVIFKIFGNK
jgi:hypothetical protein